MLWELVSLILIIQGVKCINHPVYKIALTQKGFAQALQYDVDIPPLREFTFCAWVRFANFGHDQHIFTYRINNSYRILRLWVDADGNYMKLIIKGKNGPVQSNMPLGFSVDIWWHVCLSYQSDYGAWAVYVDGKLTSCEAAENLRGFVLPGGGTLIIGYGAVDNGKTSGLEGEIYGANMLLISSIERNHTIKRNVKYAQKTGTKNKKTTGNDVNYTVLNSLINENISSVSNLKNITTTRTEDDNFIKFSTPHSFVRHNVGKQVEISENQSKIPVLLLSDLDDSTTTTQNDKLSFWNIVNPKNKYDFNNYRKDKPIVKIPEPLIDKKRVVTISQYEKPPPQNYAINQYLLETPPSSQSIYTSNDGLDNFWLKPEVLSEIETPPPPTQSNKVYGQWSSSKFAGNVLNYFKSNRYMKEYKKPPITIPLNKYSDSFPYASEFKERKKTQFIKPSFIERRQNSQPQRNLQIIEYDIRSGIQKAHAQTKPKMVEIINRGETEKLKHSDHRFYRSINDDLYSIEENIGKKGMIKGGTIKNYTSLLRDSNSLLSILPFLKSFEYFQENMQYNPKLKFENKDNDIYTKSLSSGNKWHNIKSYSNDYTPRHISRTITQSNIDAQISDELKRHPSLRLNYKPGFSKVVYFNEDSSIKKDRDLVSELSGDKPYEANSVSILKYNHGYLPGHHQTTLKDNKEELNNGTKLLSSSHNFHKQVKLGNALNEQNVIGASDELRKKSFVGGDEKVPDINRYRSDIDKENNNVPSSLGPRSCGSDDYNKMLYVQLDGSIDTSHILSSIKQNIGIQFILLNYNHCSLENSDLKNHKLLLIHWTETPVRLFGGAQPKKTIDLCGFF